MERKASEGGAGAAPDTVVARFRRTAAAFAERPAVADLAIALTYAELAALVDRLAGAVAAAVAGREGPVAILLPHEARFPAALLGVLAAGRGYVALDAGQPADRNLGIAAHAGVAAVLAAGAGAALAAARLPGVPVLDLDALPRAEAAPVAADPGGVAWITYTSGSTGKPKGVWQDHRGLLADVEESIAQLGLGPQDSSAMFAAPHLLQGTRIALGGLLAGAVVHVLPPRALGPAGVLREMRARRLSVFRAVPALFARVAEAVEEGGRIESLRLVYLGGDRVGWNDHALFRQVCREDAAFGTHLGSTECSTVYLHWLVDPALRRAGGQLPLGRLVGDRRLRLLDEDGAEVAAGETGEFVVSGRFLARGYWKEPELTAAAFGIDPVDPTMRSYRTGDLGRARPDGLYEFVGRRDRQVKLRGYRIEPGEIEGALRALPGVRDAAVVVRRTAGGVPRAAVAYVEPSRDAAGLQGRHVMAMAGQALPVHMVPAAVFIEPELPRLPNLKLDAAALAARDAARQAAEADGGVADPLAAEIVALFEAALRIAGATPADSLASLGGDSLQAVGVLAALEARFGPLQPEILDLPIADIAAAVAKPAVADG